MKRTDLFLNLFAAAAFLALGFIAGCVYHTKASIERTIEVMHRDGAEYQPGDLIFIAVGEQIK